MLIGRLTLLVILAALFAAVNPLISEEANGANGLKAATYALVMAACAAVGLFREDGEPARTIFSLVNILAVGAALMAGWHWMLDAGGFASLWHWLVVVTAGLICAGCSMCAIVGLYKKPNS